MPQSKNRTLAFYDGPAPASSPNNNRVVSADHRLFPLLLLVLRKLRSDRVSFGLYDGEAPPPEEGSRLLVASKDTDLIGLLCYGAQQLREHDATEAMQLVNEAITSE
jgi:hypothetical protein